MYNHTDVKPRAFLTFLHAPGTQRTALNFTHSRQLSCRALGNTVVGELVSSCYLTESHKPEGLKQEKYIPF